ncbi:TIGR02611 family protein [uncultured Corynebacterium sp.]|uniref:TIGR02611 family protein n=1 Tax=uncultured Corynebacterium sp. TaxID=159447 RepID=UPI0025ED6D4F|nr:TIGR02611 family protein [uncultured Corynebacterium sp.]
MTETQQRRTMEARITGMMARMADRHAKMRATWYGAFLSPVILVLGFCLLIVGIVILPTPAPGWLLIFISLGLLSLVHPPMRRLNVRLARLYDASEAWFRERHWAIQLALGAALTISVAAIMATVWYFVAPGDWPYTRQEA